MKQKKKYNTRRSLTEQFKQLLNKAKILIKLVKIWIKFVLLENHYVSHSLVTLWKPTCAQDVWKMWLDTTKNLLVKKNLLRYKMRNYMNNNNIIKRKSNCKKFYFKSYDILYFECIILFISRIASEFWWTFIIEGSTIYLYLPKITSSVFLELLSMSVLLFIHIHQG